MFSIALSLEGDPLKVTISEITLANDALSVLFSISGSNSSTPSALRNSLLKLWYFVSLDLRRNSLQFNKNNFVIFVSILKNHLLEDIF